MKNTRKHRSAFHTIMVCIMMSMLVVSISGCDEDDEVADVVNAPAATDNVPKYIFFFIGDGMASPQVNLTEAALADPEFKLADGVVTLGTMNLQMFPVSGMATTHSNDKYITDSAAAGTALACGEKTKNGVIAKNPSMQDLKTIAEMAKDKGMKVGIVSSVSIDHATPACFYAHNEDRGHYDEIAKHMDDSNFDYFGGGFARGDNNGDVITHLQGAGYTVTDTHAELTSVPVGQKCWAYTEHDRSKALYYEIDRMNMTPEDHISLAEFTKQGIRLLDNDDKGFFMMVEGGKVDWACHANDAVSATHDMVAFDNAIAVAIDFYNQHPDETLIVVTGDHECGGLTLGYAWPNGKNTDFSLLKHQKISFQEYKVIVDSWKPAAKTFEEALEHVKEHFGLGDAGKGLELTANDSTRLKEAFDHSMLDTANRGEEEVYLKYGRSYDPFTVTVTHILNEKAGIGWTSYYHTGVAVPVYALGAGANLFNGSYDNTDIPKKIITAGELN